MVTMCWSSVCEGGLYSARVHTRQWNLKTVKFRHLLNIKQLENITNKRILWCTVLYGVPLRAFWLLALYVFQLLPFALLKNPFCKQRLFYVENTLCCTFSALQRCIKDFHQWSTLQVRSIMSLLTMQTKLSSLMQFQWFYCWDHSSLSYITSMTRHWDIVCTRERFIQNSWAYRTTCRQPFRFHTRDRCLAHKYRN